MRTFYYKSLLWLLSVMVLSTAAVADDSSPPSEKGSSAAAKQDQVSAQAAKEEVLHLFTTRMGAYSDPTSKERPGVFLELAQELGKRTGIPMKISSLPWNRALHTAIQNKQNGLIFPLLRTAQRETQYAWTLKALNDRQVFFGRKNGPKIKSLKDIYSYRVGVIRGSPFERKLKVLKFEKLDIVADAETNAKKLQAGRIDFWFVTRNTAVYTLEQLGIDTKEIVPVYTVGRTAVYIAANKSLPGQVAKKLDAAFKILKKEGWYDRLLKSYNVEDAGEGPGPTSQK